MVSLTDDECVVHSHRLLYIECIIALYQMVSLTNDECVVHSHRLSYIECIRALYQMVSLTMMSVSFTAID